MTKAIYNLSMANNTTNRHTEVKMNKPEPTIITISHYGKKFTAEFPSDVSMGELCEALKGLLKACGYADETVNEYIKGEYDE
jgi:hypothetical protein